MPQESRMSSMDRKDPVVFIRGIDVILKRDLAKHKSLLEASQNDLLAYRNARKHEVKRKRHYKSLIGGGKFDDDALAESIKQINQNINHLSAKTTTAQEQIKHHSLIVDNLVQQLEDYYTNDPTRQVIDNRRKGNDASGD